MIPAEIEREILFDALDEDAVLSAIDNIVDQFQAESADVLQHMLALAQSDFVAFYRYDQKRIVEIAADAIREELRRLSYEVFLVQTDKTFDRIAQLGSADVS